MYTILQARVDDIAPVEAPGNYTKNMEMAAITRSNKLVQTLVSMVTKLWRGQAASETKQSFELFVSALL